MSMILRGDEQKVYSAHIQYVREIIEKIIKLENQKIKESRKNLKEVNKKSEIIEEISKQVNKC